MARSDAELAMEGLGWLTAALVVVAFVALAPLGVIWAVDLLFACEYPWDFRHWAAVALLLWTARWALKGKK